VAKAVHAILAFWKKFSS